MSTWDPLTARSLERPTAAKLLKPPAASLSPAAACALSMPWPASRSEPALIMVATAMRVSTGDFSRSEEPDLGSGLGSGVGVGVGSGLGSGSGVTSSTFSTVVMMVVSSFLLMLSSYFLSVARLFGARKEASASFELSTVCSSSSVVRPLLLTSRLTVSPFCRFTPLNAATPKVTPFTSVALLLFTVSMVSSLAISFGR